MALTFLRWTSHPADPRAGLTGEQGPSAAPPELGPLWKSYCRYGHHVPCYVCRLFPADRVARGPEGLVMGRRCANLAASGLVNRAGETVPRHTPARVGASPAEGSVAGHQVLPLMASCCCQDGSWPWLAWQLSQSLAASPEPTCPVDPLPSWWSW